jgi:uncharacterized protein YjiS (DUF1127 family)
MCCFAQYLVLHPPSDQTPTLRILEMAAIETQAVFAAAPRKTSFVVTLFAAVQEWNAKRQTRAALSKLTDRELSDIGITRADIDTIAG